MILKLGMGHTNLKVYKVNITDIPGLTLTYVWQDQIQSKLLIVLVPGSDVRTIGPLVKDLLQNH